FGGLGGGAGDQVGDAQAVAGQQVLLGRGQTARGEAGQVQGGPEPVARPGEVPAGRGRVQAGVDAAEQHAQQGAGRRQHVGDGAVRGRGQVGGARTSGANRRRLGTRHPGTRGSRRLRRLHRGPAGRGRRLGGAGSRGTPRRQDRGRVG